MSADAEEQPGSARLAAVEREMRETGERYRSLFQYHPNAVFSLDLEGRFTTANPAAERVSGYSADELLGMAFTDMLPPEELEPTVNAFFQMVERRPQRLEVRFRHKDGRLVDLSVTGLPIVVDDEVVGVYGIAEDITARNRMQADLAEARRTAEEANGAKSLFLANMSHEIRTPLTSVLAAAEMLCETDLDEQQLRLAKVMDRQGDRLLRLVDEILDFSRIEAGKTYLEEVPFGLRGLVDEVVTTHRAAAAAKGLALSMHVDERVDDRVTGDPSRLAQVLANLIGNAVKFTHDGWVRVSVKDHAATDESMVRFEVADSGIGVSAEQQAQLFESFNQADPSITRRYGGTGLGLAICKQLVTLMGGAIELQCPEGQGCTFIFTVPTAATG
jgi:PAS domain S-box-containing protein